jgi:COMPASS component SWD3
MRLWDFINMPCAVKKTYQGHVNENFSIGGCFGVLRRHPGRDKLGYSTEEDYEEEQREDSEDDGSLTFVASASEEGDIVMWDVNTKEVVQRIEGAHQGVCFWVDVHGDTGTMVSCGRDGRVVVHKHRYPELQNGHANGDGGYPEEAGEDFEDMQVAEGDGEGEGEDNAEPAVNGHGGHEGLGLNEEETPVARDDGDTPMDD